jgi:hypothetical protein
MEGKVLHYSESENTGIATNNEGDRFTIKKEQWLSDETPKVGAQIDFTPKENEATQIFLVPPAYNVKELSGRIIGAASDANMKFNEFRSSDNGEKISSYFRQGIGLKIASLFGHGIHNRIGTFLSIFALLSLFFPTITDDSSGLYDYDKGTALFTLLAILAIFFYGGATRLIVMVFSSLVLTIVFFEYYEFYTVFAEDYESMKALGSMFGQEVGSLPTGFLKWLGWGSYVNIFACAGLLIITFFKKYKVNEYSI